MIITQKKHRLASALQALLTESVLEQVDRTDWQSATFLGERVIITLFLPADNQDELVKSRHSVQKLIEILPSHEFTLPRWIVADISVTDSSVADISVTSTLAVPAGIRVIVEALLIEE